MRHEPNRRIEKYRVRPDSLMGRATGLGSDPSLGNSGFFIIDLEGHTLRVQASDGKGWDHVSVSLEDRCPTWDEMCYVKDLFWKGNETVVQFHPPRNEYMDDHAFCLHLWLHQGPEIRRPPTIRVGVRKKVFTENT